MVGEMDEAVFICEHNSRDLILNRHLFEIINQEKLMCYMIHFSYINSIVGYIVFTLPI